MSNDPSNDSQTPNEAVSEALGKAGGARTTAAPAKLSWREVMKDTLQEAASQGAQAITPLSQDLSALREQRRKGLDNDQPSAATPTGPKP